ncbi:MAG: Tn3 family transposase [Cyanobacteria bacterium J06639_18]
MYLNTQGQSAPVFTISYFLGIKLMLRIRNWKDYAFLCPSADATYQAFEELGKVVRTMFLLEYIFNFRMSREINAITNVSY